MAQHARVKRTPPPDGARRRWWQNRLLQLLAAFVLLCGVAAAGLKLYTDYTNSHFQVTFYRVTSSHVSEKLRVLFLSDLHLREYGEHNEELIQTVQELDPDLILLCVDLVTFPNPEYENMLSLCRSLADVAPLYGVLGNHESEMIYGGVDDQLAEKFSEAGVQLLRNETRTIQIGENNVELIGLEGALKDFYKYGASDCVESLSRQYDTFRICINHVPMAFVDYMQDAPFDLALAGHTHGGLILPVTPLIAAFNGGYVSGLYTMDGMPLYVSRGSGLWVVLPLRLFGHRCGLREIKLHGIRTIHNIRIIRQSRILLQSRLFGKYIERDLGLITFHSQPISMNMKQFRLFPCFGQ